MAVIVYMFIMIWHVIGNVFLFSLCGDCRYKPATILLEKEYEHWKWIYLGEIYQLIYTMGNRIVRFF